MLTSESDSLNIIARNYSTLLHLTNIYYFKFDIDAQVALLSIHWVCGIIIVDTANEERDLEERGNLVPAF
jgi:hypothetical protein